MAHTYGGGGRIPGTGTTTTLNPSTASINLPAGTTVLWVTITVAGTTARSGGNPTFNGVSLTASNAKADAGGTPETCNEDWYMLAPPTGAAFTLSIPNAGGLAHTVKYGYASAATGFTSVLDSQISTPGNSTNPSTSFTSVTDGAIWFGGIGNGATTWAPSGRSGTQINDWDAGSWGTGAQYGIKSGTGAQTVSWTFGTSEDWIIQGTSFKEAATPFYAKAESSPTSTKPQQTVDLTVAGYGLLLAAAAALFPAVQKDRPVFVETVQETQFNFRSSIFEPLIQQFIPPVNAAEYHYGTHQAATHDQGIRGSGVFTQYPHDGLVVVDTPQGRTIFTLPQEPTATTSAVHATDTAYLGMRPPERPETWTLPQPFDVSQGRVDHTLIQQFIKPPERPRTWTLPQPFDVAQGRVDRTLIQQFIAPPNRPDTWVDPQQYGVDQGQVYRTLIQQFIAPPERPRTWTDPQQYGVDQGQIYKVFFAPVVLDTVPVRPGTWTLPQPFEAQQGQFYRTLIQQFRAPPLRPYITTQAEVLRNSPSSFKVTTPYLPSTPPPVNYPPVNPRYQYGTHQLHHLQSSNRISITIPWQVQLYEPYFISLDTIGERDEDLSIRPSSIFHQRPAEGAPYVEPKDRPVTIQTLPQPFENLQGQVYRRQLDARVEVLASRDWANYTLPQPFEARNDSRVFHHPPPTVVSPRRYWHIGTLPQSTQLYEVNQSRVASLGAESIYSVPIANVTVDLVGTEITIHQGTLTPEVVKFVGRIVTIPKLIGATAQLEPPFDFSLSLDAGETLLTARVTSTVYTGVDPNPAAIRSGSPVIDGNKVEQLMRGGVEGCVYELLCTVTTSLGQTLQQATYFYIEPNLP